MKVPGGNVGGTGIIGGRVATGGTEIGGKLGVGAGSNSYTCVRYKRATVWMGAVVVQVLHATRD